MSEKSQQFWRDLRMALFHEGPYNSERYISQAQLTKLALQFPEWRPHDPEQVANFEQYPEYVQQRIRRRMQDALREVGIYVSAR